MIVKDYGDPALFRSYYQSQAGNGLPGFHGAPVMYGRGVGGIFQHLFRLAVPLFRKGVDVVKPHLKTAARNIAHDVVGRVTHSVMKKIAPQEGSGFLYLKRRGGVKRKAAGMRKGPPGPIKRSRIDSKKQRATSKRKGKKLKAKKKKKAASRRLKDVL